MLTHNEIKRIADKVLHNALGPSGFERSQISEDFDSDGDPALSITARFKRGFGATEGKVALDALTELRAALQQGGEERFPFLRFEYPDDEIPSVAAEDFQH